MVGFTAKNFGREKSVVLLFDRSQSMLGKAMQDATAAARSFVRSKPASDRIAVVAVGKQAFQLTGFSTGTSEADAALRGLDVDKVRGTALYDAVVLSSTHARRRPAPVARSRAAHGRSGGLEQGEPRRCDRRRERCARHGLSDRDRKPKLQARTAEAPRRRNGRPLQRCSRIGRSPRCLRVARKGAQPDVAAHVLHDRPSRRLVRARRRGSTREGAGTWNRGRGGRRVDGAQAGVRSGSDAHRHAGRDLHPPRCVLPLPGAGRGRAAPQARTAHR